MTVNIYTTSGGSTPETHTNVISVTASESCILITEKTTGRITTRIIDLPDVTSVTITGVSS